MILHATLHALYRIFTVLMAACSVIGLVFLVLIWGPAVELRFAYPVAEWEIVKASRAGNTLTWSVFVDKRRDCPPVIVWQARYDGETRVLRPVMFQGQPTVDRLIVQTGERTIVGPFTAPVPEGWEDARKIEVDALVKYNCGSPWPLPALNVQGTVAK